MVILDQTIFTTNNIHAYQIQCNCDIIIVLHFDYNMHHRGLQYSGWKPPTTQSDFWWPTFQMESPSLFRGIEYR